ncbi:MAG: branched-chain amino acid aminotransferase [Actinomycetes bacterium]
MSTTASANPVEIALRPTSTPVPETQRAEMVANPAFGRVFTDHMVSMRWTAEQGWHDAELVPYGPLSLDPATMVLHYAQSIFEGLKAYRQPDGSVAAFRPYRNAARFNRSATRMALPALPEDAFVAALEALVSQDAAWVPSAFEKSLYLRPFMFASEIGLGVRPASEVQFLLLASPAGAYFPQGVKPVSIWLSEDYTRAAPGGTGAAKAAGNYGASLVAQQEAIAHGCDQVCFLDAVERRWVEELGGMNLFFVQDDGSVVTPEPSGTILEGITRESVCVLAQEHGHKVEERPVSLDEWREGVSSGRVTEVFACGTAAVITPLGRLAWHGGEMAIGSGETGPVTSELRAALLDIQYGRAPDPHGWMHKVN